jgi:hypothetical protein
MRMKGDAQVEIHGGETNKLLFGGYGSVKTNILFEHTIWIVRFSKERNEGRSSPLTDV